MLCVNLMHIKKKRYIKAVSFGGLFNYVEQVPKPRNEKDQGIGENYCRLEEVNSKPWRTIVDVKICSRAYGATSLLRAPKRLPR